MRPRAGARRASRGTARSRDQAATKGSCNSLCAGRRAQAVRRLAQVRAHRLRADPEPAPDLLVLEALGEQAEYVELALGELPARLRTLRERRVEVGVPGERCLERADEVRERRFLEDERDSAGVEDVARYPLVGIGGIDGDERLRRRVVQRVDQFDAREARHSEVDERELGRGLRGERDSAASVGAGPDDFEAVLAQKRRDGDEQCGMVVSDQTAWIVHESTSMSGAGPAPGRRTGLEEITWSRACARGRRAPPGRG